MHVNLSKGRILTDSPPPGKRCMVCDWILTGSKYNGVYVAVLLKYGAGKKTGGLCAGCAIKHRVNQSEFEKFLTVKLGSEILPVVR